MKSAFEKAHSPLGSIDRASNWGGVGCVGRIDGAAPMQREEAQYATHEAPLARAHDEVFLNGVLNKAAVYTRAQLSPEP